MSIPRTLATIGLGVWVLSACAAITLLCAVARASAADMGASSEPRFAHASIAAAGEAMPDVDRYLRRLSTRAEHSFERLGESLSEAWFLWLWIVASTSVFVTVVVLTSVADVRMLNLRRHRLRETATDLAQGARVFFRVFRDRHTTYVARGVLAAGLCYWLAPDDLIPDTSLVPGIVDDLVIAVSATKIFFYLCPTSVVERHASSVRAEAGTEAS